MTHQKSAFNTELVKGIWKENPVFVSVLGLCPSLAVTNSLINGIAMGAATFFVLLGSSILVSSLRNLIPKPVRISLYILIIATFVTFIDYALDALFPDIHKALGAFIALIVVNCLILGRQESFAAKNTVWLSIADAIGMASGFTLSLCMIGGIREILGNGSLLGYSLFGPGFQPWVIMVLPPGGFFTLGTLILCFSWFKQRKEKKKTQTTNSADSTENPFESWVV